MTEKATTFQATPKKQFVALVKDADQKRQKIQSITGELGERIKHAKENAYLNTGAFGLVRKLYAMEEDKRADFLRSFDIYREYCVTEKLFGEEHVGDLVDDAEKAGAEAADEQQAADDALVATNIKRVRTGIKKLEPVGDEDFERGRIAYLDGAAGIIPSDLEGHKARADRYLEGWAAMSELSVEERAALSVGRESAEEPAESSPEDKFEDDAVAKKPSRRGRKALDGGDAAGSYALTH